jgi:hypothetical protein
MVWRAPQGPQRYGARTARIFDSRDGLSLSLGQRIFVRSRSRNLIGTSPNSLTFSRLVVGIPSEVSVPPYASLLTSCSVFLFSNSVFALNHNGTGAGLRQEHIDGVFICVFLCVCVCASVCLSLCLSACVCLKSKLTGQSFVALYAVAYVHLYVHTYIHLDHHPQPVSATITSAGSLRLLVSWVPPSDFGAGVGIDSPLVAYQVALYAYAGAVDLQNPATILRMVYFVYL